jgi:hypothetical protein
MSLFPGFGPIAVIPTFLPLMYLMFYLQLAALKMLVILTEIELQNTKASVWSAF